MLLINLKTVLLHCNLSIYLHVAIARLSLQSGCGYVLPCVLKWHSISLDEGRLPQPFDGEDVVAIAFFETRCNAPRTDLIVWLPGREDVTKISGCISFLTNRSCDLEKAFDLNMAMK